ncbi:MAG: outer membrane beta-barrel protein [Proteobacteria bacterium]|nr:outer membrane beta-barrel protein [Pseudomonadota bacterium]
MSRSILAFCATILFGAVATAAAAQDGRWYLHLGPGQLSPDESAEIEAGGAPFAGADVSIDSSITAAVEIGRFVTPEIAVSLTGGLPPTEDVNGAGALAFAGKLGELQYGPGALTAHYHFNRQGRIQPYVGVGVALMVVFKDDDAAATDLEVENAAGPAVQLGADLMFNDRFGAFIDYKKAFFDTEATGRLGPAPFTADIQVDPAFLHAGLSVRF